MGWDIIEFALSTITDDTDFEKLAAEVMYQEGFPHIIPLGGTNDGGRDAIEERLYQSEGVVRTVFQFSLQEDYRGKIRQTAIRLAEVGIEYTELVYVTPRSISTEKQDEQKQRFRKEHGKVLSIFERKVLVNRLSNYSNGLFHRHFPDIERQLREAAKARMQGSVFDRDEREKAFLKTSLMFTFSDRSTHTRKAVFDQLVFALTFSFGEEGLSVADIVGLIRKHIHNFSPEPGQVDASVIRLIRDGWLHAEGEKHFVTDTAREAYVGTEVRVEELTRSLAGDVLAEVETACPVKLTKQEKEGVLRNTREVLAQLLRLFGTELSSQFLSEQVREPVYLAQSESLKRTAGHNLQKTVADTLIAVLGDLLHSPTPEQAEALAAWSKAFLATTIMNLDPDLRHFQRSRLRNKRFILDTDFLLGCFIKELPINTAYLHLVNALVSAGCQVIVPPSVIGECVLHASISPRTHNVFDRSLLSFSPEFIERKVWNAFVKGYYYAVKNGLISAAIDYRSFLENYYDNDAPEEYLRSVLRAVIPREVRVQNPADLLVNPLDEEELRDSTQELLNLASTSPKASYRLAEHNVELAQTDALLFLTTLHLNDVREGRGSRVLGGTCYLLTSSAKYLKCSKNLGMHDEVTTRPQSLLALLEIIGESGISAADYVRLFENPFLILAVEQVWEDVEGMVRAGVMLEGKSLPRLQWDVKNAMHSQISALQTYEQAEDDEKSADAYFNLLDVAAGHGYRLIPEARAVMSALERQRKEVSGMEVDHQELVEENLELQDRINKLEESIGNFGKRKQRYLRRVARGRKSR
jgi:hypothetical protein